MVTYSYQFERADEYEGHPSEIDNIQVCSPVKWYEYPGSENRPYYFGHYDRKYYPNIKNAVIWRHSRDYPDNSEEWRYHVIWDYCMSKVTGNIWAEFGVATGMSAYFFLRHLPENGKFYLLDSFEGLPEFWNGNPAGTFACEVPEFDDPRAIVIKGWFEDTAVLPDVLDFVHIDCDTYSATKTVLESIKVRKGTIILFDELWGYPVYEDGEYGALMEWDVPYKFIVRDTKHRAAIEIL